MCTRRGRFEVNCYLIEDQKYFEARASGHFALSPPAAQTSDNRSLLCLKGRCRSAGTKKMALYVWDNKALFLRRDFRHVKKAFVWHRMFFMQLFLLGGFYLQGSLRVRTSPVGWFSSFLFSNFLLAQKLPPQYIPIPGEKKKKSLPGEKVFLWVDFHNPTHFLYLVICMPKESLKKKKSIL